MKFIWQVRPLRSKWQDLVMGFAWVMLAIVSGDELCGLVIFDTGSLG